MYNQSPQLNLDAAREVAQNLRRATLSPYEADVLAILGGLPGTNGTALRQAAIQAAGAGQGPGFDAMQGTTLTHGGIALGRRIAGSNLTVEELYARMAALGDPASPEPIAFHSPRTNCPHRAQLMIEGMQQLGLAPERAWAISQDPHVTTSNPALRLSPVTSGGTPLTDARGQIQWPNHLAPVIELHGPNGPMRMVIDPSLMRGPATLAEWHGRVNPTGNHSQQVTPLGIAPVDPTTQFPFPGTGFHAASVPEPGNLTLASRQAMQIAFLRTPSAGGLLWFDPGF